MRLRRIDPNRRGQLVRLRYATHEAFGVGSECLLQDSLSLLTQCFSLPGMHDCWRQQPQASVMVLVVVSVEEAARPLPGSIQAGKTVRVVGTVLQRLEVRLRVRIVV